MPAVSGWSQGPRQRWWSSTVSVTGRRLRGSLGSAQRAPEGASSLNVSGPYHVESGIKEIYNELFRTK